MKKLVTVFALCAAVSVAYAAPVESQNVVGYTSIDTPQNVNMITGVSFTKVGGGSISLQDIKMSAAAAPDGGTRIWWWSDALGQYTSAYWVAMYDILGNPLGYNGWGDQVNWVAIDKTFATGEGFWINAAANAKMVVAGQLVTSSASTQYVAIPVSNNVNVQITNPMPVQSTSLQSITMSSEAAPDGGTRIWWWNDTTGQYTSAYWVALYDILGNPLGYNGWGDQVNWVAIDQTFASGGGFWINAAANCSVRFLNPFYVGP